MKKIFTLEDLLDSINSNGNDVDVDVDGVNCIAVCPPVCLTEKGRKQFETALSLPVEEHCVKGEDKDYQDVSEYMENGKGDGGRLLLAWKLLKSLAGYCGCSDYEKWFEDKETSKIKLKGLSDKRYAMSELVADAYRLNANKISILAATVELLAKGTQHQKDAEEIIKGCYPPYYSD